MNAQIRDMNFGNNGVIRADIPDYGYDRGIDVIIQADNKVVHVGAAYTHPTFGNKSITIVRYNYDGTLDESFNSTGIKSFRINDSFDTYYHDSQIQADQKILIGGQYSIYSFIARFNPDGSSDTSFGDNGILTLEDDSNYSDQHLIRVLDNGQLFLIRRYRVSSWLNTQYSFSLYSAEGVLDTNFGVDGVADLALPETGEFFLTNFVLMGDGRLQVSGRLTTVDEFENETKELVLMRINADGSLDEGFGVDGFSYYYIVAESDLKIQADGKLVCVGTTGLNAQGTTGAISVLRFDENGFIDETFSDDGWQGISVDVYATYGNALLIQDDGKIVIGGSFFNFAGGSVTDCLLVRLTADGDFDPDFGDNGIYRTGVSSGTDKVTDMEFQDGNTKIVFGGEGNYTSFDYITVRIITSALSLSGDASICLGENTLLEAFTQTELVGWATENEPDIILSTEGTFEVSPLENTTYNFYTTEDTASVTITILEAPIAELPEDSSICEGEELILDATLPDVSYFWQDDSEEAQFSVTNSGTFWVELSNQCGSSRDSVSIAMIALPEINLGLDTSLCDESSFLITTSAEGLTYSWQDASAESSFLAENTGTYWLDVSNECGVYRDSISLVFGNSPSIALGEDLTLCPNESFELQAPEGLSSYEWQDASANSTFEGMEAGTYWVRGYLGECSSADSINIYYYEPSTSTQSITSCESVLSPSGLYSWDESGSYTDTLTSIFGCDSVLTINLNIINLEPSISVEENLLISNVKAGAYQWYTCDDEPVIIEDASSDSYTAESNGFYQLQITESECSAFSECVEVIFIGVNEVNPLEALIYPNPISSNQFTIQIPHFNTIEINAEIFDLNGKLIYSEWFINSGLHEISLQNFQAGIYILKLTNQQNSSTHKLLVE